MATKRVKLPVVYFNLHGRSYVYRVGAIGDILILCVIFDVFVDQHKMQNILLRMETSLWDQLPHVGNTALYQIGP